MALPVFKTGRNSPETSSCMHKISRGSTAFTHNTFRMHLVTSSLFLPSFLPILSPSSISNLLQTYFASVLTVWVSRGRPPIPIKSFYERTSPNLPPPGPTPTPGKGTLAQQTSIYPNAWLPILQSTILHPNEYFKRSFLLGHLGEENGNALRDEMRG